MKTTTKLWIIIAIMIFLTPLGLLLPAQFKAGAAWGEWSTDQIHEMIGYIPQGMSKLSTLWSAPFSGYMFNGWEQKGIALLSIAYIFSAVIGIAITIGLALLIGRMIAGKQNGQKK